MKRNIFIGVAWPYVNGELHIGHLAGYLLPADLCARFHRAIGNNVLMVSGSDCFGTPITLEADKKGVKPEKIVELYHEKDVELFLDTLNLTYDLYTKTNNPNHIKVAQDFFIRFLEQGYIFADYSLQYYSPTENRFLPDRYVVGTCPHCSFEDARSDQCDNCGKLLEQGELNNPKSNLDGDKVELKKTQHYYIDWGKVQKEKNIQKFVEESNKKNGWRKWVFQETMGWLNEGLKPRAVTRDLDWGVPLPIDRIPKEKLIDNIENKRLYVWFDAVIGYYSASLEWSELNNKAWEPFWAGHNLKHYYFMGKDNLIFHTLFWPGQLSVFDENLKLPDQPAINQYLNFEGKQFSKSRGHTIRIEDIVKEYGNDLVRFYLTLIMPESRDSSFAWSDFEEKVNGILIANFGNFVHRTLSIGKGYDVNLFEKIEIEEEVLNTTHASIQTCIKLLENCEYRNYLDTVLKLSTFGNHLVDKTELWNLKKQDEKEFGKVLKQLLFVILTLGYLIQPLLPESSQKIFSSLEHEKLKSWPQTKKELLNLFDLVNQVSLEKKPKPLYKKIELTQATNNE